MVSRREMLAVAGSASIWLARTPAVFGAPALPPKMGGTPSAIGARMQAARRSGQVVDSIDQYRELGLAGGQINPPSTDPEAIRKFREKLEANNMYLICDPRLPRQESDVANFENQVRAYKEAGAIAFHAAMTGRRYEDFDSLEPFKKMIEQCQKSVEMAEPVLRKYRARLGIENHKGWRAPEQAAWLKRVSSEWVGACLDFGNNLSLCEEPMDTLRALLPYTVFAHIKDMGVQEYEDGFLLSEVPMGEGVLDLKGMVQALREKDPNMPFLLEMITRDPLKIPVFTTKYWATFDDAFSPLPGRDVAKVLAFVKRHPPRAPLQRTTGMSPEAVLQAESENNRKCVAYGRQNLEM